MPKIVADVKSAHIYFSCMLSEARCVYAKKFQSQTTQYQLFHN